METPLTFGSCFAGVGGFDLALLRAGATSAFACELDPQCNSVRRRHWPDETTLVAGLTGYRRGTRNERGWKR